MAHLLLPDGTIQNVSPADGKHFTLEELQTLVGGYIEFDESIKEGYDLVTNEEAKLLQLPINPQATALYKWTVVNGRINDVICGPAVYGATTELDRPADDDE